MPQSTCQWLYSGLPGFTGGIQGWLAVTHDDMTSILILNIVSYCLIPKQYRGKKKKKLNALYRIVSRTISQHMLLNKTFTMCSINADIPKKQFVSSTFFFFLTLIHNYKSLCPCVSTYRDSVNTSVFFLI